MLSLWIYSFVKFSSQSKNMLMSSKCLLIASATSSMRWIDRDLGPLWNQPAPGLSSTRDPKYSELSSRINTKIFANSCLTPVANLTLSTTSILLCVLSARNSTLLRKVSFNIGSATSAKHTMNVLSVSSAKWVLEKFPKWLDFRKSWEFSLMTSLCGITSIIIANFPNLGS